MLGRAGLAFAVCIATSCIATSAALAAGTCERERGARSANDSRATQVTFVNDASERVRVYWIDYSGRRKFYAEVEPHDHYTQDTYMTHPWVVTDARERCILFFRPAPGATLARIQD